MSKHNITVEGGTSVRLPTAGKYCDRDIIVTAEGGTPTPSQKKTIDIVKNGTVEVLPDDGYVLSKVTANVNVPIPSGYIKPSGTKNISANGTHNVKEYENVSVDVPIPDGYIKPSGVLEVTENGIHDVSVYQQVNVNVAASGEPDPRDQYQRVEYIESDGSAYIVTDFVADDNSCGIEAIIGVGNYNSTATMGSRQDSGNTRFYLPYPLGAKSVYYGFNSAPKVTATVSQTSPFRWQTNFLNSRLAGVYTFDGASVGSAVITEILTQHTVPVAIFGLYSGVDGGVSAAKNMKLYGARCSKGNDVVREYIPCYRKNDGEVGLYEKVTGTFLTNDGGGAFAKGADIEWGGDNI